MNQNMTDMYCRELYKYIKIDSRYNTKSLSVILKSFLKLLEKSVLEHAKYDHLHAIMY